MSEGLVEPFWYIAGSGNSGTVVTDPGTGGGTPPTNVPRVVDRLNLTAREVLRSFGVATQPHRLDTNYAGTSPTDKSVSNANVDGWINILLANNVYFIRGHYIPGNAGSMRTATKLQGQNGKMMWLMEVIDEAGAQPTLQTTTTTASRVTHISENNANLCYAIEGCNEPNHNRAAGTIVPATWAQDTFDHQQAIWNTARSKTNLASVDILGPSLHDTATDASYAAAHSIATALGIAYASVLPKGHVASTSALPTSHATGDTYLIDGTTDNYVWNGTAWKGPYTASGGIKHWHQIVALGIKDYMTWAGLHSYSTGGGIPQTDVDRRVGQIDEAFGDGYPVWCTECGANTAVGHTGGSVWSETAGGIYGPRFIVQFIAGYGQGSLTKRKMRMTRYEALDQYDPNNTAVEDDYGIIGVSQASETASYNAALWGNKPEGDSDKAVLAQLVDPAGTADYTASATYLKVDVGTNANVQWMVTTDAAGNKLCWLWNNVSVYNNSSTPANRSDKTVASVKVTLTDPVKSWDVQVPPSVISVAIQQ